MVRNESTTTTRADLLHLTLNGLQYRLGPLGFQSVNWQVGRRKGQMETGPHAVYRLHPNVCTKTLDNPEDSRQPKAGALVALDRRWPRPP
jgi:hypothetical protein